MSSSEARIPIYISRGREGRVPLGALEIFSFVDVVLEHRSTGCTLGSHVKRMTCNILFCS